MQIFHVALESDWLVAQESGFYTTSTLGRTLADEGFIHACRADQWQAVRKRYYAGVREPLVLLVIDTDRLSSPVIEESPTGVGETFPHVYGAIETEAVVRVLPLDAGGRPPQGSFSDLFLRELMLNAVLGLGLLLLVAGAALAGRALYADWGAMLGALAGLVVGVPVAVRLRRRR